MVQFPYPIRRLNRFPLTYTFKDADGNKLDLADFHHVTLEYKKDSQSTYSSVAAEFYGILANGKVRVPKMHFDEVGKWDFHFVLWDIDNQPVYFGTPMQIDVVKNVRDLAANQNLEA